MSTAAAYIATMTAFEPLCGAIRPGEVTAYCDNRAGHKPPETHYDSWLGVEWA